MKNLNGEQPFLELLVVETERIVNFPETNLFMTLSIQEC